MTPRRHARAGVALAVVLLAGCSAPPEPEVAPAPRTGAAETDSPTPTATPTRRASTEPLVFAIPLHRAPLDLATGRAKRMSDGGGPSWVDVVPASRLDASAAVATVAGVDPLLDPEAYPIQVPGPAPRPVTTVRVAGDVMLGRDVAAAPDEADPVAVLRPLADHLAGADITVANLESTLSTAGPPQQGGDSFAAPAGVRRGLAGLGLDVVSLANNHTGDFGTRALLETVDAFRSTGLRAFGAGRDLAAASRPVVLRRHGVRFAFVGFNAIGETPRATPSTPGALSIRMPPRTGPLNRGDLAHVLGLVRRLHRRADVVVVVPHWGDQYTHVAEPVQSLVGRRLVGAGADLVVGGHPHWVQGLEHVATEDGGAVLAHSLGNLVFDMDSMEQTMEGVTLTATFWGDRLMRIGLTPYRMDATFAPRPVGGAVGDGILDDVWRHSTGPFRRS